MRTFIRFFPAIVFLTGLSSSVIAADTLKIHLTYKHKLDDAGRSQGYTTINQKFYTPDQVLFREINYDEQSGQIASYVFYFYAGDKLSTEECYNQKDSLLYILKHEYDAAGRESQELRFEPVSGIMQVIRTIAKSYDQKGKMIAKKEYEGKKLGVSVRYDYEMAGLLARENQKYKAVSKQPLKIKTLSYIYNPDKTVKQVIISAKDLLNNSFQGAEDYTYNGKGQLSSIRFSGPDYPAGLVKTYKYLDSGVISICQESDAAGNISKILQYDYKKHYMEKGVQVSYFVTKN
jgi:hypothetical protein